MPRPPRILCSSAQFNGREREYVLDCLDRGWITQGPYVKRFEESFAALCGTRYAVACSSGTAALHLALLALGIGPGDAVIVPALTYVATANATRYCGADVVFCDIDPQSWCMDVDSAHDRAKQRAGLRTFFIPVHLYDSLAETDRICGAVVEDAAHAPGSKLGGDYLVGSLGDLGCFSFYASKIIACGEGGMVTTSDDDLNDKLRLYRGQGAPTPGVYHHSVIGYNYRMTDVQAAIGLAQLEQLPENLSRRRQIADLYREILSGDDRVTLQSGERASAWTFAILVPETADRDTISSYLSSDGIETRPFFQPLHTLPMYAGSGAHCPVAESVARRGLCLPLHTGLSDSDVEYVCEKLREALDRS